jgi:hypothetical protein
MANLPSSEDIAREIVSIMVHEMHQRPDEWLPIQALKYGVQRRIPRSDDFLRGVEYAVKEGWLSGDDANRGLRLTASGFEAAQPLTSGAAHLPADKAPVFNIHGNVGVVQTGTHARAQVVIGNAEREKLVEALQKLQEELTTSADATPEQREHAAALVTETVEAVKAKEPDPGRISGALKNLSTTIRTLAAVPTAWHAIHHLAVLLGYLH